jgi:hypothetical protein
MLARTFAVRSDEEDRMVDQVQESLITTDEAPKSEARLGLVQLVVALLLVTIMAAFGIFTATHASGEEMMKRAPAQAKVLPDLNITPESLEPNLSSMLATGDGGASLPLEETVGGISREAFKHHR